MHRLSLAALLVLATTLPAAAQTTWAPWYQPSLLDRGSRSAAPPKPSVAAKPSAKKKKSLPLQVALAQPALAPAATSAPAGLTDPDDLDDPAPPSVPAAPIIASGGPRPEIEPRSPSEVAYESGYARGTIVIDSSKRRLYLVQSSSSALSYPVSVGREGFAWNGSEKISRVANWPDWHPPAEMRERDPKLPNKMLGGVRNPLGAKALYLGNTLYRIHGTSDARSVGRAASSGCFRMHNGHVVDLASRVGIGTKVVVKNAPYSSTVAAAAARSATVAPHPTARPAAAASRSSTAQQR